jgi:hypothetical protein
MIVTQSYTGSRIQRATIIIDVGGSEAEAEGTPVPDSGNASAFGGQSLAEHLAVPSRTEV